MSSFLTFDVWMDEIEEILRSKARCSSSDISDCEWAAWYHAGQTPESAILSKIGDVSDRRLISKLKRSFQTTTCP